MWSPIFILGWGIFAVFSPLLGFYGVLTTRLVLPYGDVMATKKGKKSSPKGKGKAGFYSEVIEGKPPVDTDVDRLDATELHDESLGRDSTNWKKRQKLNQYQVDVAERSYIVGVVEAARVASLTRRCVMSYRARYRNGWIQAGVRTNQLGCDRTVGGKTIHERRWEMNEEIKALLEYNIATMEERYFLKPIDMSASIENYFKDCDKRKVPYTLAGMIHWLGFCKKSSIKPYLLQEGFYIVLSRAMLRIEQQRNEQLIQDKGPKTGHIFDLKNNFGWIDEMRTQAKVEAGDKKEKENEGGRSIKDVQLEALPPKPKSMSEWEEWYKVTMKKPEEAPIDVEPNRG